MSLINTLKELFGFRLTKPEPKKNKRAPKKEKPKSWVRYTHHNSRRYVINGPCIYVKTTGHSIFETRTEIFELEGAFVICQTHYDGQQYTKLVRKPCPPQTLAEEVLRTKDPNSHIDTTSMKRALIMAGFMNDDTIILQ
jgi:hypothetical protein